MGASFFLLRQERARARGWKPLPQARAHGALLQEPSGNEHGTGILIAHFFAALQFPPQYSQQRFKDSAI